MSRSEKRLHNKMRQSKAKDLFKLEAGKLEIIDLSTREHPDWMTRAYSNNRYVVMICDNAETSKGAAIRCMIQRHDNTPIPNHWAEIQKVKNEIFGKEAIGIEYYPKESELVDVANIYWLWIFKDETHLPIPIIL